LIAPLAAALERPVQDGFSHGAHLAQRACAATVLHTGARFQPPHGHGLEREVHDQPGTWQGKVSDS
jgi:hypothetical protein